MDGARRGTGSRAGAVAGLIAAALLAATAESGAQANFPVDDFEILDFDALQVGPGGDVEEDVVAPPLVGHIISQTRRVQASVASEGSPGEVTRATLDAGGSGNDAMHAFVSENGSVGLFYEIGYPADLTAGGSVDRFEVDMDASPGTTILIGVQDENLVFDSSSAIPVQAGTTSIPFGFFDVADMANIIRISVWLHDEGQYVVREIRLRGDGSEDVDFLLHAEATFVPPLPSAPVQATIWSLLPGAPLFDVGVSITQADAGFLPQLAMSWSQDPAFEGSAGSAVLDWTDLAPFDFTQLAFTVQVADPGTGLVPELYPPDPVHGPEGVTLVFPVMLRDGPGGQVVGTSETWMTIEPGALQAVGAMELVDVQVTAGGAARGGAGDGGARGGLARGGMDAFTVSFLLQPGAAGVETIWPILDFGWWSDWTPNTTTAAPALAGSSGADALQLVAVPSVTRAGTEIRASRPFARTVSLLVHDVAGRRVAELPAPAGARAVTWNGRDADGRPAAAGVYFVSLPGTGTGSAARIVKVR